MFGCLRTLSKTLNVPLGTTQGCSPKIAIFEENIHNAEAQIVKNDLKSVIFYPPMVSHSANISGRGVAPLSLNLNHCLSDLLLIVDLYSHPRSTRVQIKSCQYC